jgi:hypothetical protein
MAFRKRIAGDDAGFSGVFLQKEAPAASQGKAGGEINPGNQQGYFGIAFFSWLMANINHKSIKFPSVMPLMFRTNSKEFVRALIVLFLPAGRGMRWK